MLRARAPRRIPGAFRRGLTFLRRSIQARVVASTVILPAFVIAVLGAGLYVPTVIGFGFSPKTTDLGYQPGQPVPFSHALHAGELGMDCRYCHNTVEKAAFAALPATQTCMNCHTQIKSDSAQLEPVRRSWLDKTSACSTKSWPSCWARLAMRAVGPESPSAATTRATLRHTVFA